jgi:hypothetical protein
MRKTIFKQTTRQPLGCNQFEIASKTKSIHQSTHDNGKKKAKKKKKGEEEKKRVHHLIERREAIEF